MCDDEEDERRRTDYNEILDLDDSLELYKREIKGILSDFRFWHVID